jgi:hypothetical protein
MKKFFVSCGKFLTCGILAAGILGAPATALAFTSGPSREAETSVPQATDPRLLPSGLRLFHIPGASA